MNKKLIAGLAVALVAIMVTGAMAFGPGYGRGMGYGAGPCYSATTNLTPEQAQKYAQFQKEILPLKQKMLQLRTELMTLHTQTTPDWNAISAKQKEMIDVRTEIQKKASAAELTGAGFGPCGACMGRMGMGRAAF